jgi:hypothetical protein
MSTPLISIIVNNFNYAAFLRQSVESALVQTHPRTEVIVVDDGSTDNSREIIRSFGTLVVPVLQERNGGQAAALNQGFGASHGDLVIFLDADDYLYPTAAARVVSAWAPAVGTVQYRLHMVDPGGKEIEIYPQAPFDSGNVVPKLLATGRYVGNVTSGNAFARETLRAILPIPVERFRISADGYLLTVAPFYGSVASIEEPLGAYRKHGANHWLAGRISAQGFRRQVLHDLAKQDVLAERAAAFGLTVAPDSWLGDSDHLLSRLGSLLLDPEQHPVPSDARISLAQRGVRVTCRTIIPWSRRAVLAAWYLSVGLLPARLARKAFTWRWDASSRPRALAHALRTLRRSAAAADGCPRLQTEAQTGSTLHYPDSPASLRKEPHMGTTLQINLAPTDLPHVRHILPHQLRQFGGQVDEILLTVDLHQSRGRFGAAWKERLPGLLEFLSAQAAANPKIRVHEVDYSSSIVARISEQFFGGQSIPPKDWNGGPFYSYFSGFANARYDYILHLDSDMMFGGGGQGWIAEATRIIQARPEVLVCNPHPGPPTADGTLRTQTLAREPHTSVAFRAGHINSRVAFFDRRQLLARLAPLRLLQPSLRCRLQATLEGNYPYMLPEDILSVAVQNAGLCRIDFLGEQPGMWSLHPPYRNAAFYDRLPSLIEDIEQGKVPSEQLGAYDVNDSMVDWSSVRKGAWHRKLGRLQLIYSHTRSRLSSKLQTITKDLRQI